ncbi:MAG TPA: hypothetical protein VN605_06720 [Thermoanaerobaculia bacterium]|nr:hypothetical protein [Thermoanaerobaculia bacterium]
MTRNRFEAGCLLLMAIAALAALLFLVAGALHLWNALAHLDWLRERVVLSRLTFAIWTAVVWIAAAFVQRTRLRGGAA